MLYRSVLTAAVAADALALGGQAFAQGIPGGENMRWANESTVGAGGTNAAGYGANNSVRSGAANTTTGAGNYVGWASNYGGYAAAAPAPR